MKILGWGSEHSTVLRDFIPPSVEDDAPRAPVIRSIPRPVPPPRTVASVYAEREECTLELAKLLMRASDVVERREELSLELEPLIEADELKYKAHLKSLGALKELVLNGQQRIVEIRERAEESAAERAQGEPNGEASTQEKPNEERIATER